VPFVHYRHSLCGKLQCTSVSLQNLPAWSVVNNASGVLCWSSDFDLGSDIPDPAQVHDGTACGEKKVRQISAYVHNIFHQLESS